MPSEPDRLSDTHWGEMPRAVATVLLAVYLVGLTLTVLGNSGSGTAVLVGVVKGRLFEPWMNPPWLDLGFDYFLTYGQRTDAAHRLEARAHGEADWLPYPQNSLTGPRAARWQRLLRSVVMGEGEPGREGLLPAALGAGLFTHCSCKDVDIRILVEPRPERQAPLAQPEPEIIYEARVRQFADGDVQLIKMEGRREVAPVVTPTGAGQSGDGQ